MMCPQPTTKLPSKYLTGPEIAYALERYRANETIVKIAIDLGRNQATISRVLKLRGVPMRQRYLAADEVAYLVEHYQAGESSVKIAKDLGRTQLAIWRHLKANGVKLRGRVEAQTRSLDMAYIHRSLVAGLSYATIAQRCHVSKSTIIRRIRAHGLPRSHAPSGRPRCLEVD